MIDIWEKANAVFEDAIAAHAKGDDIRAAHLIDAAASLVLTADTSGNAAAPGTLLLRCLTHLSPLDLDAADRFELAELRMQTDALAALLERAMAQR